MAPLTRFALRAPGVTCALLAVATAFALAGAARLTTDTGFRSYLGPDHRAVRELDRFLESFGGGLPVAAVWSCRDTELCSSVFDDAALRMAADVSRRLERVAGVRRVQSPATAPLLVPSEAGFDVRRLVDDEGDREALARRARADPLWSRALVSEDGAVGAIVVELASSESGVSIAVIEALREALAPHEAEGFRFALVGQAVELLVSDEELAADSARLIPVTVALIATTVWLMFRTWQAVLATLACMGLALLWTFGLLGALGWPQNAITQTLSPLILVIGVADAIHLLSRYASERLANPAPERDARQALLLAAARDVGPACAMASLTTAAGFLSFTTSGAQSFVRFGVVAAFGIGAALVTCFSLLPILLAHLPAERVRARDASESWEQVLDALVRVGTGRPRLVVGAAALGLALAVVGLLRLRVEVDAYELYGPRSQVVQWARFVEENLRYTDGLEIELALRDGERLEDPARLAELAAFSAFLREQPGFVQVRSLFDPLARVNRLLHDDAPEFERPGDTAEANSELLLLLSLQGGPLLEPWLSLDQRRVRVSVEAQKMAQSRRVERLDAVKRHLDEQMAAAWSYQLTGPLAVYFHMVEEIHRTQLSSFSGAGLVVFAAMALFLRSLRWGFLALIPTVLPVLVTLGAMGLWGIHLDMGTAMVGAIVLGIADDDAIHLLDQYRRRRRQGMRSLPAIRAAVRHVGRAVVTTSLALSLGFFTLVLSAWQSVASFGLLAGVAILGALAADLLLLPALIAVVRGDGDRNGSGGRA